MRLACRWSRVAARAGSNAVASESRLSRPPIHFPADSSSARCSWSVWRSTARSEKFQREFLAQPLAERRATVEGLREKSKQVIQEKAAEIMDVNDTAVREALRRHGVTRLVHGHTHRAGHHRLELDGRACERWVLPDWYGTGGYLELAGSRARLVRW